MSESTCARVTPLHTSTALDEQAMHAQRLALLVELTAEQFAAGSRVRGAQLGMSERLAVRHLEAAAVLARQAAEHERARCATAYAPTAAVTR